MGALLSSPHHLERTNILFPEGPHYPYHNNPAPDEASQTEEDSKTYYVDFYEKASCAPHRDGRQVVVYWIPEKCEDPRETPAWAVKRLKKIYERLRSNHPRIVHYNSTLDGTIGGKYGEKIGGLVLEKLTPGPIHLMNLPALITPASDTSDPKDLLILSLYYRWALQALFALSFFHSHGVFLRVFTSQMVWLRSDFSLAITGFISAVTKDGNPYKTSGETYLRDQTYREYYDEASCEEDDMATDEDVRYEENGRETPGVREDLFEWATFVWRLMTTGEEANSGWPSGPNNPRPDDPVADYGQNRDTLEVVMRQRAANGLERQQLERERLGEVLVKAWKGGYENTEEVIRHVQTVAETIGLNVVEDEVDIGMAWKDALQVVERKIGPWNRDLRLKKS